MEKAPTALIIPFLFLFLFCLNLILGQQSNHYMWNSYTDVFGKKQIK